MLYLLYFFVLTLGHADLPPPEMQPLTNLGRPGDAEVSRMYQTYARQNQGCRATLNGPRVILTGFGLFSGRPFNTSGAVVANLADARFWPGPPAPSYSPADGILQPYEPGVRVVNRAINFQGHDVNVCLILVDVLWDFAGAVFAAEMERFQPNLVMMLGETIGSPVLEAAALNLAAPLTGFYANGRPDSLNRPRSRPILNRGSASINMHWDNQRLARVVEAPIQTLGYTLSVPQRGRPSNDYICNNVSYIALAAADHQSLSLAGGRLKLSPQVFSQPQVGFMHLPALPRLNAADLHAWSAVILRVVSEALYPTP